MKIIEKTYASDRTIKYAISSAENERIEACVLFFEKNEKTEINICISCQIGCNNLCDFCIAGHRHFVRDLSGDEIVEELNIIMSDINSIVSDKAIEITYMGSGEPFDNIYSVLESIKKINELYNGIKRINISTLLPSTAINPEMFKEVGHDVHIQFSLHATNDQIRNRLFRKKLPPILESLEIISQIAYVLQDRFCVNYVLFSGINDSDEDAQKLCELIKKYNCYTKVSEYAEINESGLAKSSRQHIFCKIIEMSGIDVRSFVSHGNDVNAACGNFYKNYI